jgi:hypothetical protein
MTQRRSSPQGRSEEEPTVSGSDPTQRGARRRSARSGRWTLSEGTVGLLINNALIIAVAAGVILFAQLARSEHRDAVNLAALFFVAGLLFAQLLRSKGFGEGGDWPLLAVIALPAIMYLVLAGYVTGLKIPGGLEVEIKELLDEAPKKLEASELDRFANATSAADCDAVVNAVVLVEEDDDHSVGELQRLLNCNPNIDYVVIVNSSLGFVGMVAAPDAIRSLESPKPPQTAQENVKLLGNNLKSGSGGYESIFNQEFRDDWAYSSSTIGQLLKRMNAENLVAIALVDRMGRFEAVVEREELLSQLMVRIGGFDEADETPAPTPTPTATRAPSPTPGPTLTPSATPKAGTPPIRLITPRAAPTVGRQVVKA